MTLIEDMRALGSLVTDPDSGFGRPVRIDRYDRVGTGWNPQAGVPTVEPGGQFTTNAVLPGTDAAMQGVIAEGVSRPAIISTGAATTGSFFQPAKGDWLVVTEGPELHQNGVVLAAMVALIETVDAIAAGGSLRLGLHAPFGVMWALGGGTPSD